MQQPNSHFGFRSAKGLSLFAVIGLSLLALCSVLSGIVGAAQLISPDTVIDLDEAAPASVWLLLQGVVYLFQFPLYITTVVGFLMWVYRAHSNLQFLQPEQLDFTPGWAVGWWFIPFANLVKPFQAIREIWSESDPEVTPGGSIFSAAMHSAPTYMAAWWGFWIGSNILANITSNVYNPDRNDTVTLTGALFIVTAVANVIAAALAIRVVRDTTSRQEQRFRVLGTLPETAPPPPPAFAQSDDGPMNLQQ